LISSRYPAVGVFDDLTADAQDLRAAFLLESATNDRLLLLGRRLTMLPDEEIVSGPGATLVMGAFLHADQAGGRFTDGRLGAWYASFDLKTAVAETLHHSGRRLRLSAGGFPSRLQIRELIANVDALLVDIRGQQKLRPDLYDPDDYRSAQGFGTNLRWPRQGSPENGIAFDSVRRTGGINVCVFRPSKVRLPVIQGEHLEYHWDAQGRPTVIRLTTLS
jgi:hypothetical protein